MKIKTILNEDKSLDSLDKEEEAIWRLRGKIKQFCNSALNLTELARDTEYLEKTYTNVISKYQKKIDDDRNFTVANITEHDLIPQCKHYIEQCKKHKLWLAYRRRDDTYSYVYALQKYDRCAVLDFQTIPAEGESLDFFKTIDSCELIYGTSYSSGKILLLNDNAKYYSSDYNLMTSEGRVIKEILKNSAQQMINIVLANESACKWLDMYCSFPKKNINLKILLNDIPEFMRFLRIAQNELDLQEASDLNNWLDFDKVAPFLKSLLTPRTLEEVLSNKHNFIYCSLDGFAIHQKAAQAVIGKINEQFT